VPKLRTTRQISSEQESFVANLFLRWNGKASSSSGASIAYPHDVESDLYVTECKATEGKSISIKLDDWLKIRHRAGNGRLPSMAFRFRDPYTGKHVDLFMKELVEEVDQLDELFDFREKG
jgi:hypothetical protein